MNQNYPNPFYSETKNSWQSSIGIMQTLMVYDALGREVATLVNAYKPAGNYEAEFNAKDYPSGIYFYRLTAGDYSKTMKMIYLK